MNPLPCTYIPEPDHEYVTGYNSDRTPPVRRVATDDCNRVGLRGWVVDTKYEHRVTPRDGTPAGERAYQSLVLVVLWEDGQISVWSPNRIKADINYLLMPSATV